MSYKLIKVFAVLLICSGLIKFDMETGTETKWLGEKDEFLQETIFATKKNAGEFVRDY